MPMLYEHLNFYPLLILVCVFAPVLMLIWGGRALGFELTEKTLQVGTRALVAISVLVAANYVGVIGYYLASPAYLDHVEPTIAANAYVLNHSQPLYHSAETGERYSLVYGPLAYLPYSLAMGLAPYGFLTCKLVAAVACFLTLFVGILCLKKWLKGPSLVLASGFLVALFLALGPDAFLVRADPILCLLAALGLWAAARAGTAAAVVLLAVALGAAVNVKVHAPIYFVFPLLLLVQRAGRKAAGCALLGAGIVSALPFLLPQVSLRNWFQVLRVVGQHGFGSDEAIWAGQWFIYLGLFVAGPLRLLQIVKSCPKPLVSGAEKSCWAGLLLSMAGTLLFASKSGARPVQWLPFVPMLLYAAASVIQHTNVQDVVDVYSRRPWLQATGLAFLLTALISAGIQEARII